jgi:branched-chain amino acid transport system substrate-binding protein
MTEVRRAVRPPRTIALAAVGLLALLSASACARSTKASSAGGTSVPTERTSAQALGTRNDAKGAPIRIGFVNEEGGSAVDYAPLRETADAAVSYINQYLGGIGGRPIALVHCASKSSPAGATDCANQMVEEKVAAVLAPITGQGSSLVPIITRAGIPYVSYQGLSLEELTSPEAFSLAGGLPSALAGIAKYSSEHDIKKVSLVAIDVPAVAAGAQIAKAVFGKVGVELDVQTVPPGTPDMTPQLAAATKNGADAVGVLGDPAFCTSFFQAYETLGLDLPKFAVQTCLDDSVAKAVPGGLTGTHVPVTSIYDPNSPEGRLYRAVLETYAPKTKATANNAFGYTTVLGLHAAISGVAGDVTAAKVAQAMGAAVAVPLPMSGGATFTCDGSAIAVLRSVCSAGVQMAVSDSHGVPQSPEKIDTTGMFAF